MTRFFRSFAFAFTACASLVCGSAKAAVIFSNLPATASGDTCDGVDCSNQGVAGAFTPGGNFTLLDVVVPVANLGGTNGAFIELLSDASGSPGSVLEQWTVTGLPSYSSGSVPASETVDDVDSLSLVSGDQYWVAVLPEGETTKDVVFQLGGGESDHYSYTHWQTVSEALAFEVDGTAVSVAAPEPGTICLLALGLVAIGLAHRGRASWITPYRRAVSRMNA